MLLGLHETWPQDVIGRAGCKPGISELFQPRKEGASRRGNNGEAVLLPDQDRTLWDGAQIQRGMSALEQAQRFGGGAGNYALQAAIVACQMRRSA